MVLLGAVACAACRREAPDAPTGAANATPRVASLVAVVGRASIEAPDSIAAGWTRNRLVALERGHNLIVMRIDSSEPAATERLRAAFDTARGTPAGALSLGGPEGPRPGDTSEVIVRLAPGRHALACLMRNRDGHRHTSEGEWHELLVTGDSVPANDPAATVTVRMLDFAFAGPAEWAQGDHLVRAANDGAQDHLFILHRLNDGVTLKQWMDAEKPGQLSQRVGGLARTSPGQVAYFPATLSPGTYVLVCLIPDPASGKPHVELGMFREIRVQ
jgi:hypothetical protein